MTSGVACTQRLSPLQGGVARSMGGDADVDCKLGYPSVVNDKASCAFLEKLSHDILGKRHVHPRQPTMGGEDFAFYLDHCPGVFFRLGTKSDIGPGHSPTYDFNDDALETGMLTMTMTALRWLEEH